LTKPSLFDLAFLIAETSACPKHVGAVLIGSPTAMAKANFAKKLFKDYMTQTDVRAPFNRIIQFLPSPRWVTDSSFVLAQHVHYHELPGGVDERETLYALVSKLHEPSLDRKRPLWEMHVIAGLKDGKFALYLKLHHAMADGVTMTRWITASLSQSAEDTKQTPVWAVNHEGMLGPDEQANSSLEITPIFLKEARSLTRLVIGLGCLAKMFFLESTKITKNAIAIPFFSCVKTPITGKVTKGRQIASATVSMQHMDAIRERTHSTLNHVALTCLDGALHRYLEDRGVKMCQPISIQMPVNLRAKGQIEAGNHFGLVQVELSHPTTDPHLRLHNIGYSLRNVRAMIKSITPEALEFFTIAMGLLARLIELLQLSNILPPLANTLVSNVAGPKTALFLKGARIEEILPVSTIAPGQFLNITLFSYANTLFFGLLATDQFSDLKTLARYVEEEFAKLE